MAEDREIAGIRCTEILAKLDDYVDGNLSPELVAQINKHLSQCQWCAQFGGEYAAVVTKLQQPLLEERGVCDTSSDDDAAAFARQLLGRANK